MHVNRHCNPVYFHIETDVTEKRVDDRQYRALVLYLAINNDTGSVIVLQRPTAQKNTCHNSHAPG